jgi:uncharacterized protein (DUF2164 family)
MAINFEKSTKMFLLNAIKHFFAENLDEEIGDLKAEQVLEFFVKEVGPSIYNQAITDAQRYFHEKASDLGDVRYEPEFNFWKKR